MRDAAKVRAANVAWLGLGAVAWLWPAIHNGFPLVFTDTGDYIRNAFDHDFLPMRAVGYPLFLRFALVSISSWLPLVAQTALTLWLWSRYAEAVLGVGTRAFAFIAIVIAATTSGPKYTSWLIADAMTSWLVAAPLLFLFARGKADRTIALAFCAAATLAHSANAPVLIVSLAGLALIRFLAADEGRQIGAIAGLAVFCSLCALILPRAVKAWFHAPPTSATATVLLSRLQDFGLLAPTLAAHCPTEHWALCAHHDLLRRHQWRQNGEGAFYLWDASSPRWADPWDTPEKESIVRAALADWPRTLFRAAVIDAGRAFVSIEAGEALNRALDVEVAADVYRVRLPRQTGALLASRQARIAARARLADFDERWIYLPAVALLALQAVRLRSRHPRIALASAYLLVFLVTNAVVTGVLSGPYGRYQGRVAWIAPLFLVLSLWRTRNDR